MENIIKVRVINTESEYYNEIGIIWNKGNGNMYQVGFAGTGIYISEKDFVIVK